MAKIMVATGALHLGGFESSVIGTKKDQPGSGWDFCDVGVRTRSAFLPMAKIMVATSVCTGGGKAPPEPCI